VKENLFFKMSDSDETHDNDTQQKESDDSINAEKNEASVSKILTEFNTEKDKQLYESDSSDSEEDVCDFNFGFDFEEKLTIENLVQHLESSSMIKNDSKKIGGSLKNDFTPWWDEFTHDCAEDNLKKIQESSVNESWLDPVPSGSSWLLGDSSKPSETSKTSSVKDIPVPSIYDTKLTTKGKRQLKRERKAEREKTLGKGWFNMRAPSPDSEAHKDMELIRMRGVLDPKRFYKKHDRKAAPKYFQMGTVVDEGTEYYGARLTKKQRKHTLVEELMADAQTRQYNKKKYAELQQKMRSKTKQKGKKSK